MRRMEKQHNQRIHKICRQSTNVWAETFTHENNYRAMWEEGSTQEGWRPPAGCTGRRFYIDKIVTILPVLIMRLHNSVSPCVSLEPSEPPSPRRSPGCLLVIPKPLIFIFLPNPHQKTANPLLVG